MFSGDIKRDNWQKWFKEIQKVRKSDLQNKVLTLEEP